MTSGKSIAHSGIFDPNFLADFQPEVDISLYVADPHQKGENSGYFGSEPGDIIYDHCGLTICVRDGGEFSKYFVYDGDGELLTSDSADSPDCASLLAENWVQAFHVDDEFCAEDAGYEPIDIKYHEYTIRLEESVSGHWTYSILNDKGAILATNTLTYEEVARACAEAWIRKHCLEKSV